MVIFLWQLVRMCVWQHWLVGRTSFGSRRMKCYQFSKVASRTRKDSISTPYCSKQNWQPGCQAHTATKSTKLINFFFSFLSTFQVRVNSIDWIRQWVLQLQLCCRAAAVEKFSSKTHTKTGKLLRTSEAIWLRWVAATHSIVLKCFNS